MRGHKYITSIGVITIILSLSSLSIIVKDKEKSDLEMRTLQTIPTFNNLVNKEKTHNFNAYAYGILTGNIFECWDNYFSDHIFLRNEIVNIFNDLQENLNREYINDVILGKDNYLFSFKKEEEILNEEYLINRAGFFNNLANKINTSKIYIVNLPSKDMVYENKIPIKNYQSLNNNYMDIILNSINNDLINIIDCRNVLKDKEKLYYETDHHWNMEGTYKGYEYIIQEMQKKFEQIGNINSKNIYNIEKYEKSFIGTDGKKVKQFVVEKEDIEVYKYKSDNYFNTWINGDEGEFFYDFHLDENKSSNNYSIYLNGDNPEVIVKNLKADNKLKIVMIGDSMDNPLIPLMADHFDTIYSYDLRHYDKNIIEKINDIKPDIVMLIGLSDSFIEDKGKVFDIK